MSFKEDWLDRFFGKASGETPANDKKHVGRVKAKSTGRLGYRQQELFWPRIARIDTNSLEGISKLIENPEQLVLKVRSTAFKRNADEKDAAPLRNSA